MQIIAPKNLPPPPVGSVPLPSAKSSLLPPPPPMAVNIPPVPSHDSVEDTPEVNQSEKVTFFFSFLKLTRSAEKETSRVSEESKRQGQGQKKG